MNLLFITTMLIRLLA